MSVSALMEAMAAAGAPMEAIVIAVRALEAKDAELKAAEQEAADKRAAHAAWKKARRAELSVSMDSPRTEHGQSIGQSPAPSPSSSPDPSNNPTPTPVESPRARKGSAPAGHRLPESWQPEPLTGPIGEATEQWPPGAFDRELARFRDWAASATGPNAKKSDWQAAFRNWLRKAEDEGRYRNEPVRSNRGPTARSPDGFINAIRESAERRSAANH